MEGRPLCRPKLHPRIMGRDSARPSNNKKTMKLTHLLTAFALAFVTTDAFAEKLVIKGSDTLGAKLVPQLAEQFKAQHHGTTFDIAAEGSTTGIAAVIDGPAQIGMSTR